MAMATGQNSIESLRGQEDRVPQLEALIARANKPTEVRQLFREPSIAIRVEYISIVHRPIFTD